MRFAFALLVACGGASSSGPTGPASSYDDKPMLTEWPGVQTAFVARAAEDLGCEPAAVVVVAFTEPHSYGTTVSSKLVIDRTGLAIAECAGARVTYAVLPEVDAARSNQPVPQTAFVMIARVPVVANTPTAEPEPTGSN